MSPSNTALVFLLCVLTACSPEPTLKSNTSQKKPTSKPITWQKQVNHWGGKEFYGGIIKERLGSTKLMLTCNNGHMLGRLIPQYSLSQTGTTQASLFIISNGNTIWKKDLLAGYGKGAITFHMADDLGQDFRQALPKGRLDIYVTDFNEAAYFDAQTWGQESIFSSLDEKCRP